LRRLALRSHPGDDGVALPRSGAPALRRTQPDRRRSARAGLTAEESAASPQRWRRLSPRSADIEVLSPGMWNLRLSAVARICRPCQEAAGRAATRCPQDAAYAPWRQASMKRRYCCTPIR
jgi:hypothetical protein